MNKLSNYIENTLLPISNKISTNVYIQAIQRGIMASIPLIIIGSLFTLLINLPYKPYIAFVKEIGLYDKLNVVGNATTGLMALFTVFFIAYHLVKLKKLDGAPAGMISLFAFFILTPQYIPTYLEDGSATSLFALNFSYLGSTSLFLAIMVGLIVGTLYATIINRGWTIKMPDGVPPQIASTFTPIIATGVIALIFVLINIGFSYTSFGNIHVFITNIVQKPMMTVGQNLWFFILLYTLMNLSWFFGIHGAAIYGTVMPIVTAINMANLTAYQAGQALPSMYASWVIFFMCGGLGNTLGLNIYMVLRSKSKRYKELGKMCIVPGFCNINEPLIFGMPMVMNPLMLLPMIINPLVVGLIAYFAMSSGMVPFSNAMQLPWTTPRFVMALLYGGTRLMILQLITMVVSGIMYIPFFNILDKQALIEENHEQETESKIGSAGNVEVM